MTNEERMRAIADYNVELCGKLVPDSPINGYREELKNVCVTCMKIGVKLFLGGLWHEASEKPKPLGEWIIVKCDDRDEVSVFQVNETYAWERMVKYSSSFHWCYLSDLFPKEGGEG